MNEILVSVAHLVKNYASEAEILHILRGISFEVPRGTSVAVTGQSGSGKSTLLNILGGLDRCDSGSVMVGDAEITGLSESSLSAYRRDRVGFIFQFHYLLKDFTALENVMLPAYMAGMKKKDAFKKAELLLADVKLADRLRHFPSQLSGGERQRVAVARALVNDPDLILADEPTGNLDPDNSGIVAELLYAAAEKWGKTLMVVTHDEKVAARAVYRYTLEGGILASPPPVPAETSAVDLKTPDAENTKKAENIENAENAENAEEIEKAEDVKKVEDAEKKEKIEKIETPEDI